MSGDPQPAEPEPVPQPVEPEPVLSDDLLVEAARAGRLRQDSADPLDRVLAGLHDCARGRCTCADRLAGRG